MGGLRELVFTNSVILHAQAFGNLGGDGKAGGAGDKALAERRGACWCWTYTSTLSQIDYGAAAGKYVEAFFANVEQDEVNRRYDRARGR